MRVMRARIYVGGPMSGIADFNYPAFDRAAKWLRCAGFDVVSPADISRAHGHTTTAAFTEADYRECMRLDIEALVRCDAIALLPGWDCSRGATHERAVAEVVGLSVFLIESDQLDGRLVLTPAPPWDGLLVGYPKAVA